MYRSFGYDVGVKAIAEVYRVDVVTTQRRVST